MKKGIETMMQVDLEFGALLACTCAWTRTCTCTWACACTWTCTCISIGTACGPVLALAFGTLYVLHHMLQSAPAFYTVCGPAPAPQRHRHRHRHQYPHRHRPRHRRNQMSLRRTQMCLRRILVSLRRTHRCACTRTQRLMMLMTFGAVTIWVKFVASGRARQTMECARRPCPPRRRSSSARTAAPTC